MPQKTHVLGGPCSPSQWNLTRGRQGHWLDIWRAGILSTTPDVSKKPFLILASSRKEIPSMKSLENNCSEREAAGNQRELGQFTDSVPEQAPSGGPGPAAGLAAGHVPWSPWCLGQCQAERQRQKQVRMWISDPWSVFPRNAEGLEPSGGVGPRLALS